MKAVCSEDGTVSTQRILASGQEIIIKATTIRRERGGVYALVGLFLDKYTLAYDDFKLANREDRRRLAKDSFEHLGPTAQAAYPLNILAHDLDFFCLEVPVVWDEERFQEDNFDDDGPPQELTFILRPLILDGGGTILFGPPKSGKSYLCIVLGLCIASGLNKFFPVEQRPVYYVNLERSAKSMERRVKMVRRALGLRAQDSPMTFLNARGSTLPTLAPKIRKFRETHPNMVGIVDSISRVGMGSMVQDEAVNNIINSLNQYFPTAIAVGHSPRNNQEHIWGLIFFDAGADITIQVASERKGNTLGLSLIMRSANDMAVPPPYFFALEFSEEVQEGDSELIGIRLAKSGEFPQLSLATPIGALARLIAFVLSKEECTSTEAAKGLGLTTSFCTHAFLHSEAFVKQRKQGRNVFYSVKDTHETSF